MLSRILPSSSASKRNYNIERVKFGAPLDQVIPGPLLVLILKLNKEAPFKKDVFRAPGHQANMKKLIHFLQNGRLVNIDNFSVYTIASVLKKFLRKLPGGIFGNEIESRLFEIIQSDNVEEKREEIHRLIISLPVVNQQLLILLFGTFRAIANSSDRINTGMTSEAIGVSVAPSFFQSCVSDGSKIAKMEDVQRFKVATTIMKFLIDNFGVSNLFGRENYEYYARISGRVLKVEQNWIFAFKYPPYYILPPISTTEECQSTPTLCPSTSTGISVLGRGNEQGPHVHQSLVDEAYTRLSMSLEDRIFKVNINKSSSSPATAGSSLGNSVNSPMQEQKLGDQKKRRTCEQASDEPIDLDELKMVNKYAESTKSLTFLPMVHERQTQRMKTRSEWFLNPGHPRTPSSPPPYENKQQGQQSSRPIIRRTSSKEKRLVRKSSSKKDKENGKNVGSHQGGLMEADMSDTSVSQSISETDPKDPDVQSFHTTLTYKPRI